MKYTEFQNKVAAINGYRAELDKIKVNGLYAQENRVHVFSDKQPEEVAKIYETKTNDYELFEILPDELKQLVEEFAKTPIDERGFNDIELWDSSINFRE